MENIKICKTAIISSNVHKIKKKYQEIIDEYYLKIGENNYVKVLPNATMNCRILCIENIKIELSMFNLQPIAENEQNFLSYIHRKINGILLPLTLKLNTNFSPEFSIFTRIICNEINKTRHYLHFEYETKQKIQINYWSESFIGKSFLKCSPSSLSINDCKFGFLKENENPLMLRMRCPVYDALKNITRHNTLMKISIDKDLKKKKKTFQ